MGVERVTFVIQGENRADVLARVVQLFQDLKVEIDVVSMVRRRGSPRYSLLRFSDRYLPGTGHDAMTGVPIRTLV